MAEKSAAPQKSRSRKQVMSHERVSACEQRRRVEVEGERVRGAGNSAQDGSTERSFGSSMTLRARAGGLLGPIDRCWRSEYLS